MKMKKRLRIICLTAALVAFIVAICGMAFDKSYGVTANAEEVEVIEDSESDKTAEKVEDVEKAETTEDTESNTESDTESAIESVTESAIASDTKTETTTPTESVTESANTESANTGFDIDVFLAFMQKYADEAGVGDEYAQAVEAIKTAASEKQVTLSTLASVAQLAVFVVYLIYTNIKNGKLKKSLLDVSSKLDAQIKGTNGLIDESNDNGTTTKETQKEVTALKSSMESFVKGFMTFVDRTKVDKESKESIKHELNAAVKAIGGTVTTTSNSTGESTDENNAG